MKLAHREGERKGIIEDISIRAAKPYLTYPLGGKNRKTKGAQHVQSGDIVCHMAFNKDK